jgi:hypothetical protein
MSPLNYTLLVGAIAIVVGILLCLGFLSLIGQLHLGEIFHKQGKGSDVGKSLSDL